MAPEIERKFLLDELPEWLGRHDSVEIEQGYLAIAETAEVRVRRSDGKPVLTVKRGSGESRQEIEVGLGEAVAEVLWSATGDRRIAKRRYLVPLEEGLRAEVDVYSGRLGGLAVVEVEFPDEAAAKAFRAPPWFGRELTGERAYANQSLALDGVPNELESNGRSQAYRLKRKEEVGDGLRRIAAGRAEKALARLRGIEAESEDLVDAIHGARKDLKKLRAIVRLLHGELDRSDYKLENHRYRDAGRLLSGTRDAQVKVDTLAALDEHCDDLPAAAMAAWRGELQRECERTQDAESEAVAAAIAAIEAGRRRIDGWRFEDESWQLLASGVRRTYERGKQAMERAEREPSADNFHQWRKRAKDLWYLLRLLRPAWPELLDATTEQAHRLADLLGDHHDLAVLAGDLEGRQLGADETATLAAAIVERQRELAAEALELGGRLYAEKPKAFRRRLRVYWDAWRP
jgi:CYTH domain-containing protein/CHAD domain-containing protein